MHDAPREPSAADCNGAVEGFAEIVKADELAWEYPIGGGRSCPMALTRSEHSEDGDGVCWKTAPRPKDLSRPFVFSGSFGSRVGTKCLLTIDDQTTLSFEPSDQDQTWDADGIVLRHVYKCREKGYHGLYYLLLPENAAAIGKPVKLYLKVIGANESSAWFGVRDNNSQSRRSPPFGILLDWAIAVPNARLFFVSFAVSLSLVGYALSALPGKEFALGLLLVAVYCNFGVLYLRERRLRVLEAGGDPLSAPWVQKLPKSLSRFVIKCEDVSLSFRLPGKAYFLKDIFLKRRAERVFKPIDALKNVSFELDKSEILGIIGKNGAGKSTLLRLIGGIYRQDRGKVLVKGKVASLFQVGAGFHPDYTARENLFLNAAAMGIPARLITERYDRIVEWAGLGEFMDLELRYYSSGMRARLGFAAVFELHPEILLIDEALAAGDAEFTRRCNERLKELLASNTTVVVVTHQLSFVKESCTKAMWLHQGEIRLFGEPKMVVEEYQEFVNETYRSFSTPQNK